MTKAGCSFGWVKGFFVFQSKTTGRKRSKRWRWIFGRLKRKSYASIVATEKRTLSEATEERRKHALTVAIATAAAAEAAVAAAHAAAEVVRLTTSQSQRIFSKTDQNSAALKIQSAFRAHLARKALRALKGLVRLQAIARGRAVRRRINASLNRTRSETKGQTERPRKDTPTGQENETKIEDNNKRSWDGSILSKEEMEFSWLRKQEAIVKRERMKKYSFSHREKRIVGFLEEETAPDIESRPETSSFSGLTARFRPENERKQSCHEELSLGRRSFCHVKHNSAGDESLMPSSPVFPSYMAVTESAKAKTRSTSLPKQRAGFLDGYSHCSFTSRDEPASWLLYNGGSVIGEVCMKISKERTIDCTQQAYGS